MPKCDLNKVAWRASVYRRHEFFIDTTDPHSKEPFETFEEGSGDITGPQKCKLLGFELFFGEPII